MQLKITALFVLGLCLSGCGQQQKQRAADTIYSGGVVITMNDQQPQAEAVAVSDGKIIFVGSDEEVKAYLHPGTQQVNLLGRSLLPGFIDAHGHVSTVGLQAMSANLLPVPDGKVNSVVVLQQVLTEFISQSDLPAKTGLVMGFGYDDSQLQELRHPTKAELDQVSTELPIIIMHQSGHLGVANSKALAMAGISAATTDPQGGVIRRLQGSDEPDGVLEELAFFTVLAKLFPMSDPEFAVQMLQAGQALYLKYGYTTIQDGRVSPDQVHTAIRAAEQGLLKADLVSYPDITDAKSAALMQPPWFQDTRHTPAYRQHFRIGGMKLTLDGSPQGKTAWLSQPYYQPPAGQNADYAGYAVMTDQQAQTYIEQALRQHWQLLVHVNGDKAIDQFLQAMQKDFQLHGQTQTRPVLIHGQTLRQDQVAPLKQLGIFPSVFPMHTFYWGDWHRTSVLGPERAEHISPTGWLLLQDMMFTSHHDAPVAFPDSMRVLSATVNRTTRTGYVLGPQHRVEPLIALKALTLWAAWQHFEEASKGSIEAGKLADFVILSDNPLTVPKEQLASLKVLQTIKQDKTVYKAD